MKTWKKKLGETAISPMRKITQCQTIGTPYLVGDDNDNQKRKIIKARCKKWDCEYCAPINRETHYNRVANGLLRLRKLGYDLQFVTITCHEKWRGYQSSVKNWRRNKDKLLARVRRFHAKLYSYSCEYVYIPETHEDGTVHIHGLFSGHFPTRWWKDNARACGLGYMAESSVLESIFQGLNYVTKYISKQMGKPNISRGFRRINYSRGFPTTRTIASRLDWRKIEHDETIADAILEGVVRMGYETSFDNRVWSTDDFLADSPATWD